MNLFYNNGKGGGGRGGNNNGKKHRIHTYIYIYKRFGKKKKKKTYRRDPSNLFARGAHHVLYVSKSVALVQKKKKKTGEARKGGKGAR